MKEAVVIVLEALLGGQRFEAFDRIWALSEDYCLITKLRGVWFRPFGDGELATLFRIAESLSDDELFSLSANTTLVLKVKQRRKK